MAYFAVAAPSAAAVAFFAAAVPSAAAAAFFAAVPSVAAVAFFAAVPSAAAVACLNYDLDFFLFSREITSDNNTKYYQP